MNLHFSCLVTSLIPWIVPSKYFYDESNTRSRFEVLVTRYNEYVPNKKQMKLNY